MQSPDWCDLDLVGFLGVGGGIDWGVAGGQVDSQEDPRRFGDCNHACSHRWR